ncbi:NAD(P)-binding protein [Polyangium sp. y55x31]|uniref:NAD(P)-binding protein n=1 Tax=Polyangium sp. y55x31 TaxID=3042688 RepID=UPI002482766C|nr:NAD(P)-binding protein [Polyangium sp. y55x31]MDI1476489.1 NAD(P)-binding protein [Polyangium sp. y55x31]
MAAPKEPKIVTIFGGGIAGLTAAHELSERGFQVFVWEKDGGEPTIPGRSEVGGMARTQWTRVNWPAWLEEPEKRMRSTEPIIRLDEEIYFAPGEAVPADPAEAARILAAVAEKLNRYPFLREVDIEGFADVPDEALTLARANYVKEQLVTVFGVQDPPSMSPHPSLPRTSRLDTWGLGDAHDPERPADKRNYVGFFVREAILPGEHGFRFFPAFYWHLFDTMRRTPILEDVPVSPVRAARTRAAIKRFGTLRDLRMWIDTYPMETTRTVYDNLVSTSTQAVMTEREGAPALVPRRVARSFEVIWRNLHALLVTMRFTLEDMQQFERKLFKYLTSSSARREKEYEQISWWDFLEGDRLNPELQESMDAWPQALVAMSAREGDARTQGNVTMQLMLDQLADTQYLDGTLNGPTSEAWFAHWRRYLEAQGVRFIHGELRGIRLRDGEIRLDVHRFDGRSALYAMGYFLIALPAKEVKRLVTEELVEAYERAHPAGSDEGPRDDTLRRIRELPTGGLERAHPEGALQHLSGIQYYFAEDIQWVNGHTYFPDSDWGLSSISQAIFWRQKPRVNSGYRGTLSVCIANWYKRSRNTGKCAWESSREEIAREVWRQIVQGLEKRSRGRAAARDGEPGLLFWPPPEPLFYHIDDAIRFKEDGSGVLANDAPLLINRPGEWASRPGEPGKYGIYFDTLAFAGTYMKTYTRLTTMEAANESARHAVNAILAHAELHNPTGRLGNLCAIWPPEERELEDLRFLRDLDEKLVERGLPHFLDIVGAEGMVSALSTGANP